MPLPHQQEAAWKPTLMPTWNGLCGNSESAISSSIVVLVDSGATHSFVAQKLVQKYQLPVTLDDDMKVTLADGSLVTSSTLCQVPLVACSDTGKAVAFGV